MEKTFLSIFLLVVLVALCRGQGSEDIDPDLLNDIFGPPLETITVQPTTGRTTVVEEDGSSCICVPYYLCDPETNSTVKDGKLDGFGVIDIRFKPESCQESVEVCCKTTPREEPPEIVEHPERLLGCGIRNDLGVDIQITGAPGNESEFGEFPWTVAILLTADSSSVCVGSLIHPQVVLTGAHCLVKRRPVEIKIRAGEWDTQTTKERLPHVERSVKKFIRHPMYNEQNLANDIGLIVLNEPIQLVDNINTVCLPPQNQNFESAKDCFATGWGKTFFGKAGRYAVIMKKIKLDAVQSATCQRQFQRTRLGPRFKLHPTFLCAGGRKGQDTCQGDGGAPLACPSPVAGRYFQAGIVAWGIGCGQENVPGAYAYVSKFRNWIDSQVQAEGFTTTSYTLV